ncbi:MAG: hypothetical protein ACE5HP_04600 [Gemmatimonadota bacterium]
MAFRKFRDRRGTAWQVRPESKRRWWFEPVAGTDEPRREVTPPLYADDPFELSEQELQRLLDGARPAPRPADKPPLFRD